MGCGASKVAPDGVVTAHEDAVPMMKYKPKMEMAAPEPAMAAPLGDKTAEVKPPPPNIQVTIEGTTYSVGDKLGEGVWADVFKGEGPDGEVVAIKMLRDLGEKQAGGEMPPRNPEEQIAENVIECTIHKWIQGRTIPGGALVPKMLGSDGRNAAIEFVKAQPFEAYLRKKRDIADAAEIAKVSKVCAIVLKKVLTLEASLKGDQFSHRDLNNGNIMIEFKAEDEDVRGPDDVDVWLFDFGKSMAVVDGQMVSGGMWDPNKKPYPASDDAGYDACRISVFNTTTDTVRVVSCIVQDLIRSYKEDGVKKDVAPSGATRAFLEANVPFASTLSAWLAHTKAKLGEEEFGKKWAKFVDEGRRATKGQSGHRDFLDFATQPAFPIMIAYYNLKDEADWCKEMLPESIIEACDAILMPAA